MMHTFMHQFSCHNGLMLVLFAVTILRFYILTGETGYQQTQLEEFNG